MNFNSDSEWQIKAAPRGQSNQGDIVFFIVNVKELFGMTLDSPGMKSALNAAFDESRKYIPIDTGLMRRSYTMRRISDDQVYVYFDPAKILGQKRKGITVDDYYPKYLAEKAKTFNWLTIVMSHFYDKLFAAVKGSAMLMRDSTLDGDGLDIGRYSEFMKEMMADYGDRLKKARKQRDAERMKRRMLRDRLIEERRSAARSAGED